MKTEAWTKICPLEDLPRERGVTALVHGQAVAVFRTHDDAVYALGNHDPFSKASVLARGIVGTRGDIPFVASPMHKQAFDLRTGKCLDDESVKVPVYDVRVEDGIVHVGPRQTIGSSP
ncbi:MAG TPA: nitrite reductase small subunit NirD [Nocardioidaceae bacterium]|nr:nitrite reductase small subunit NirD [Nocardioidaceae bacterium]